MAKYESFGINGQLGGIDSCIRNIDIVINQTTSPSVISRAIDKIVKEMFKDIQKDVPQDTKDLIRSWKKQPYGTNVWLAGFDIIYAAYQQRGRRFDGSKVIRNRPAGGKTGFMKTNIDNNLKKYQDMYVKETLYAIR